ncbi:MAG TPA: hypothetical protein VFO11_08110 [Candidatus Polarisedimenticolaceae bacterium]|nr:hypothetical protein [Candidatus Polarisedimenticolaceae bacterium]
MRILKLFLTVLTATVLPAHAAERYVDLTKPGAMEQLKRENPAHYRAVSAIVQAALRQEERPGDDAAMQYARVEWLRIQSAYKAKDVDYSPILLTSNPPKRELSFRLDEVRYRKLLTLPAVSVVAEPAGGSSPGR